MTTYYSVGDDTVRSGSGSVTIPGEAGWRYSVVGVIASFSGPGPQTGRLTLKEGATTIWDADVSGGLRVSFLNRFNLAAGASVTLQMTGGLVTLLVAKFPA